MLQVLCLRNVALTVPTKRLQEAREFSSSVLGLGEKPRPPEPSGRPSIWYPFGPMERRIQTRPNASRETGAAFIVDDLDAWKRPFAQHGVEVIDQPTICDRRRFNVRDPFGNLLEFTTEGDTV